MFMALISDRTTTTSKIYQTIQIREVLQMFRSEIEVSKELLHRGWDQTQFPEVPSLIYKRVRPSIYPLTRLIKGN